MKQMQGLIFQKKHRKKWTLELRYAWITDFKD